MGGSEKKISTIVDFENPPKKFNIYKVKFCDIKDFDDRIIETEFARYEYEKKDDITYTDEPKLYFEDLNSISNPPELDDFIFNNDVVNVPVSSEYTANYETFKIENNDLSEIWRLNPVYCRWSFQNSLHSFDQEYMLNNTPLMEDFNRGPNIFDPEPKRVERNLDYFYTINSSTSSYEYHSLHIQKNLKNGDIDDSFTFDLRKYLNNGTYSQDYFSYLFDTQTVFLDGAVKRNTKKFSQFNIGDGVIPNTTLFKGLEFKIYKVDSVTLNDSSEIENINISSSNLFEDWKFSILLSDNDFSVFSDNILVQSANTMNWKIIEDWRMDKEYKNGDVVIYEDILYVCNNTTMMTSPGGMFFDPVESVSRRVKSAPYNDGNWNYYNPVGSIFWSPTKTYTSNDFVYHGGDFYSYVSDGVYDFWNPNISSNAGYSSGDIVFYRGQWYVSSTSSNNIPPDSVDFWIRSVGKKKYTVKFWSPTKTDKPKWSEIDLWNPSVSYVQNKRVVHDDIVWQSSLRTSPDEEPGISKKWTRRYSFVPDTNLKYNLSITGNPIIKMNNRYYLIQSNSNSTLDNGLVIYINKKWKNILVNINIADNTMPNIRNTDRDLLYEDLYGKLTANNFMNAINDIGNKYEFTDYVTYVVIEENGSFSKYNLRNNLKKLPFLIKCEAPDSLRVKTQSLTKRPIQLPEKLKPYKVLKNGNIKNLSGINWYNELPVAAHIIENKFPPKIYENLHGNKNIIADEIYRFTGYYMPLFYEIELFEKSSELRPAGNYKFDTTLTNFGLVKERKMRKCNLKGSILKLKNTPDLQSIYPMLDEYGYTISNFFIFKSTWDYEYHLQTIQNPLNINIIPKLYKTEVETISEVPIGRPIDDNKNISDL